MHELDLLYAEGFVARSMDDGLSKEATAELLMHASVQRGDPDYARGFYANGARPVLCSGDFEKSAVSSRFLLGLKGMPGAAKSFFASRPRTTFALGSGAAAAGAGALGYSLPRGNGGDYTPFLPADGSFDAAGAKARQEGLSESVSKGVFDLNKQLNSGVARQGELESAVATNSPESHLALAELQKLKADRNSAGNIKMRHAKALDASRSTLDSQLSQLISDRQRLQDTRAGRGGVGGWFRRLWYNMNGNGLGANEELDRNILSAQQRISGLNSSLGLVRDQQDRLSSGSIGAVHVPSPAQVQRDFFPTY